MRKGELRNLINERSRETNTKITKWQSDTGGAVGKLFWPARVLNVDQVKIIIKVQKLKKRDYSGIKLPKKEK